MSTDPGPFEQVYGKHVVGIYRFVHARVGNRPDAEDLSAQVIVRAVEQLDTSREPGQIAAWLYRVAQNAIADHWRAFYRLPVVGVELRPRWSACQRAADLARQPLSRRCTCLSDRPAGPVRPRVRVEDGVILVWTAQA